MPNEFRLLTRIKPLSCGKHDPTKTYEINSLVTSADGTMVYLSVQDVPAGKELGDSAYWVIHTDLSMAAQSLHPAEADDIARISRGHLRRIWYTPNVRMQTYREVDGAPELSTTYANFSEILPCPRHLGLRFVKKDENAPGCYLYLYRKTDTGYEIDWSVLNHTTSDGVKNYFVQGTAQGALLQIPEDMYMRIGRYNGEVELYEWDGKAFGPAVSADLTSVLSGGFQTMRASGGSGITLPAGTKAILCRDESSIGYIKGMTINPDGSYSATDLLTVPARFFVLPGGYDYYRAHFNATADESGKNPGMISRTGDVSGSVCVALDAETSVRPSGKAIRAVELARKLSEITWTPAKDRKVTGVEGKVKSFCAGVAYNGLPYGSGHEKAHFIGWHASLHTFLNAVNDPDSIFYAYTPVSDGSTTEAPYYSTVCSAFATMAAGWPIPTTNVGYIYDPDVSWHATDTPPIGAVWSNIYDLFTNSYDDSHCVVPERVDWYGDECAVSAFEAIKPITERTTRYSALAPKSLPDGYRESGGADYYDRYGIAAYYVGKRDMDGAPYLDFEDLRIVNGTARPYKGDKSVYTSEEEVLVNIKASGASTLYLLKEGETNAVPVTINKRTQIDVKEHLSGDGIYYVYTDVDSIQESFEYFVVNPITYTVSTSGLTFSDNDFWYAQCKLGGHPLLHGLLSGAHTSVPCEKNYSRWFKDGRKLTDVMAVFRKGHYGAYTVPITEAKG